MLERLRKLGHSILHLDDTPHRIALGLALGLLVAWTPTVGVQTLMVVPLAWLCRANIFTSIVGIYLSNPLTLVQMYWLEYKVGAHFMRDPPHASEFTAIMNANGWAEWFQRTTEVGWDLAVAMWIGGLILGAMTAMVAYFVTYWLVRRFRALRARLQHAHEIVHQDDHAKANANQDARSDPAP